MTELTTNGGTVRQALLVIADIRGYTPFMKAHWTSLAHAQDVVARLLEAVIDAATGLTPLEIEGDAAFFYAWSGDAEAAAAHELFERIVAMHRAFHACQQRMVSLNTCRCEGCRQTGRLRVKFAAHLGEVAVQRVKQSAKLAGLGVILVHRMLKASVPVPEYLLLSDTLFQAAGTRLQECSRRIEEELAGLGPTAMHFIELSEVAAELPPKSRVTHLAQARENFGVIRRSLPYLLGLRRPRVAL
jgi:class 3 adenylate cyclase